MQNKRSKIVIIGSFVGFLIVGIIIGIVLWGGGPDSEPSAVAQAPVEEEIAPTATPEPTEDLTELPTEAPTEEPTAVPTEEPTATPEPTPDFVTGPFGPNSKDFPTGMSMLTGEMVDDPETLSYLPAMISITNWPVTARPQAGLGSAALVYELYIGDGMSRFLTLFYGDYPELPTGSADTSGEGGSEEGDSGSDGEGDTGNAGGATGSTGAPIDYSGSDSIGPIRSGRLPYESIRSLNNGFLVIASAFSGVAQNLGGVTNIYGNDPDNINSASISVDYLKELAASQDRELYDGVLSGNVFLNTAPEGGVPGDTFWFIYNSLNQIAWKYDPAAEAYYRYADQADGKTFVRLVDGMNGETVDISNVVLLYANHRYCNYKAFDIDFYNMPPMPAVLFRNGQKYDIHWTTQNTDFEKETGRVRPIRFVDDEGNPFPLKPGATWIILVPFQTPIWESQGTEEIPLDAYEWLPENPDVQFYGLLSNKLEDTGVWVSRFYQDLMIYDPNVCAAISVSE